MHAAHGGEGAHLLDYPLPGTVFGAASDRAVRATRACYALAAGVVHEGDAVVEHDRVAHARATSGRQVTFPRVETQASRSRRPTQSKAQKTSE